jgi:hypothetical protein
VIADDLLDVLETTTALKLTTKSSQLSRCRASPIGNVTFFSGALQAIAVQLVPIACAVLTPVSCWPT